MQVRMCGIFSILLLCACFWLSCFVGRRLLLLLLVNDGRRLVVLLWLWGCFATPVRILYDRVIVLLARCILSVERRRCLGFMRRCGVHLESDHGHW